jgi:hypothetical protein
LSRNRKNNNSPHAANQVFSFTLLIACDLQHRLQRTAFTFSFCFFGQTLSRTYSPSSDFWNNMMVVSKNIYITPMPPYARCESENEQVILGTLVPKPNLFIVDFQKFETTCCESLSTCIAKESNAIQELKFAYGHAATKTSSISQPVVTPVDYVWFTRTISPYCDFDGMDE